jgi:hypothetical protein
LGSSFLIKFKPVSLIVQIKSNAFLPIFDASSSKGIVFKVSICLAYAMLTKDQAFIFKFATSLT